ncbi:hypothetical protein [Rathayibacter sp. VKM Ac-2927]|uniref:hypothetical protein n=1 Tax=Rathayibacter sp. VKM Ac-2927 TaxID=2929478 RepID=UPI001FB3C32A|nr:hypothetical protein [Rathayibacter sp. VKM Ac-2927]MCJ1688542.1 hypothetical protein [Rathayibacter sp. VKM Ac-2927]
MEKAGFRRHGSDPAWVGSRGSAASSDSFGFHTDWLLWNDPRARFSLTVRPAVDAARAGLASVQFVIERADAVAEEPTARALRAHAMAREGSAVERWFVAGEQTLAGVLVNLLRRDPDRAVVAAAYARPNR